MLIGESTVFELAAAAMRKLATAASSHIGSDCYIHAALVQKMLESVGIKSVLVVGHAGWRVGDGDSDVVLHIPQSGVQLPAGAFPYHVWLEFPQTWHLLDVTTYQLRSKAAELDAADGGRTTVDWCPDFLLTNKNTVSPLKKVIQKRAGMYYYARHKPTEEIILCQAPDLDPTDISSAITIFNNPDIFVMGPNQCPVGGIA